MPLYTPGEKYRPSNGSEGDWFTSKWCENCCRDDPQNEDYCDILTASLFADIDDSEYPKEWVIAEDGRPCCTAFQPHAEEREVESRAAAKHRENEKGQGRLFD